MLYQSPGDLFLKIVDLMLKCLKLLLISNGSRYIVTNSVIIRLIL